MKKKVLVVGSGGREHAICWKLAKSSHVERVYSAPGNGGTANEVNVENIAIETSDFQELIKFAKQHNIDLTVVGPDNPLAEGIVDAFQAENLRIFGPSKQASRLESSKVFSKQFMSANNLPTARFEVFNDDMEALRFCIRNEWARVIKVDGLALGKGVYVCNNIIDCENALREIFDSKRFGPSGDTIVIEERLYGAEISLMVLCDGNVMLPLSTSHDYKRRFDNNKGPNTGGMGAYSPVPDYYMYEKSIETSILKPLEKALREADFKFQGLLYIGIMIHEGIPYILEFNARFGDPETQALLPRLNNDLFELLDASVDGTLSKQSFSWSDQYSVCLVLSTETYPESGSKGIPISIKNLPDDVIAFHAGTKISKQLDFVTNGGRIINLVAMGETLEDADRKVYKAVEAVNFEGMAYRKDIAKDPSLCLSK